MGKKSFDELDLMDNFLLLSLASDKDAGPEFGRLLAEGLLQEKVGHVRIHAEKIVVGNDTTKRGIRMDVEMQTFSQQPRENDNPDKIYDFEPHHKNRDNIIKRNRFSQAKIDSNNLHSGENNFDTLPDLCIVNILDYDPFGKGQTQYHFHNMCEEDTTIPYQDGLDFYYFITKSPHSENEETNALLRYMQNSTKDNATTELTHKLHELVTLIKNSATERNRYMTLEEYIHFEAMDVVEDAVKDTVVQTRREDILEALHELGELPSDIEAIVNQTVDIDKLKTWSKLAIRASSLSDFIDHME